MNYVNADVLSQLGDNGILHLVTYSLKKMAPAECNYEIYNKELLESFDVSRNGGQNLKVLACQ